MTAPPAIRVIGPDRLEWNGRRYRCVLGKGGRRLDKREGDGATPVGRFALRRVFYRPDIFPAPPRTGLPTRALAPHDGWCDDPADANYNRLIRLPSGAGHERLWREDRIYDLIVEVGYNDDPPMPGRGSAIFMHAARPDFAPTEGCVALRRDDLLSVLGTCDAAAALLIAPPE